MKTKTSQAIITLPKTATRSALKKNRYRPLVLIVDDMELMRLVVKVYLEQTIGVRVLSATTTEEALQLARKHPKLKLVISDVYRPGMDGLAFLKVFKKERPSVPVVMVSGLMKSAIRQRAYRLGATACYWKPFALGRFVGAVLKILEQTGAFESA